MGTSKLATTTTKFHRLFHYVLFSIPNYSCAHDGFNQSKARPVTGNGGL
jgi:hypothetical protein